MFSKRTQTNNFVLAYTEGHLLFIALHSTSLFRYRIKKNPQIFFTYIAAGVDCALNLVLHWSIMCRQRYVGVFSEVALFSWACGLVKFCLGLHRLMRSCSWLWMCQWWNWSSYRITSVVSAVQAARAPRYMWCPPSNPQSSWMETNRCYLGKVTSLEAVCGNSYFIESFLAVVCG